MDGRFRCMENPQKMYVDSDDIDAQFADIPREAETV
jgi:hypothetical protein